MYVQRARSHNRPRLAEPTLRTLRRERANKDSARQRAVLGSGGRRANGKNIERCARKDAAARAAAATRGTPNDRRA